MFEAFRLVKPLASAARTGSATSGPLSPATAPADPVGTPAKRLRRASGSSTSAAAADGGSPSNLPAAPAAAACPGGLALELMGDAPLRLVIVGHNPSQHAWDSGHFYSNPSNWMWRILRETGIAPPDRVRGAQDDRLMPAVAGVGFTDVGSGTPGTDSSQFSSADFQRWRPAFFARLAAQALRASAAVPGCSCGSCGAPTMVAFSGKRQFAELFAQPPGRKGSGGKGKSGGSSGSAAALAMAAAPAAEEGGGGGEAAVCGGGGDAGITLQARRPSSVSTGRQRVLPEGWPLPLSTEVWVMTSTSGAAPMTREARLAPWQALAARLAQEAWPRCCVARCSGGGTGRGGAAAAGDSAAGYGAGAAAAAGGSGAAGASSA